MSWSRWRRARRRGERLLEAAGLPLHGALSHELRRDEVVADRAHGLVDGGEEADDEVPLVDLLWDVDELGGQRHAVTTSAIWLVRPSRSSVVTSRTASRSASSM